MSDLPTNDNQNENTATHEAFDNSHKQQRARKRAANRDSSRELLEEHGVEYYTPNKGIHLIVTGHNGFIDFWPGTGKWKARDQSMSGFGVFNLINMVDSGLI